MDNEKEEFYNNDAFGRQTVTADGINDGKLAVSFSNQDLEVRADFIPAILNGRPLSKETVKAILEKINVTYGICWNSINEAIAECNSAYRPVKDILIAKGNTPETEVTEYFEMNPLLNKPHFSVDQKAQINYRERSPFIIVKKGQILAKLRPRKPGKEGRNVHGVIIPFDISHPEGVTGGANTRTEGDKIIAEIHGQLIEIKKELSVQENLVIKGAVGYATGNIIFPGDVSINGPVSDGFKIFSGGSLTIKQTLDLTEVITKGDITVAGGIIGKGPALIKSGGNIKTKFIENCNAAARKSVLIDSEIINSSIFALETVQLGEKGKILGSEIYAVHGLRAGSIGKKIGKATKIHCGVNFAVQQEMENSNNQLRILAAKLARLREMMKDPDNDSEKLEKMEELLDRLEGEQETATARITALMDKINADENATVEVLGEITAGTLIEICQIALYVEEPLHKVRIRLDKAGGKLVSEQM